MVIPLKYNIMDRKIPKGETDKGLSLGSTPIRPRVFSLTSVFSFFIGQNPLTFTIDTIPTFMIGRQVWQAARVIVQTLTADIGLRVSSNISTLANYDIDAVSIETFRFIMVIGKSKHSMASWTRCWQSFHDLFCLNSNNHKILYVGILTKAAIAENYSSSILQTWPLKVISCMPFRISNIRPWLSFPSWYLLHPHEQSNRRTILNQLIPLGLESCVLTAWRGWSLGNFIYSSGSMQSH